MGVVVQPCPHSGDFLSVCVCPSARFGFKFCYGYLKAQRFKPCKPQPPAEPRMDPLGRVRSTPLASPHPLCSGNAGHGPAVHAAWPWKDGLKVAMVWNNHDQNQIRMKVMLDHVSDDLIVFCFHIGKRSTTCSNNSHDGVSSNNNMDLGTSNVVQTLRLSQSADLTISETRNLST